MIVRRLVAALCGAVLLVSAVGCAAIDREESITAAEARSRAVEVFRDVTALAPTTWPDGVPDPIANDCQMGRDRGVQFTYFAEIDAPADPRALVQQAAAHWREDGYTLTATDKPIDDETGHIFAVVARASGEPRASMSATRIRAHIYIDSVCAGGDPDDYR